MSRRTIVYSDNDDDSDDADIESDDDEEEAWSDVEEDDGRPKCPKVRKAQKKKQKPDKIRREPRPHKPKKGRIKEEKKRVSNAITFRGDPDCVWIEKPHPQAKKPVCIGKPEVWCTVSTFSFSNVKLFVIISLNLWTKLQSRQELCESLPYFRSYQSGTYHNGGVMRGYLMDGCAGPRDFANGRIVISHRYVRMKNYLKLCSI